jgi:hypothetical protein
MPLKGEPARAVLVPVAAWQLARPSCIDGLRDVSTKSRAFGGSRRRGRVSGKFRERKLSEGSEAMRRVGPGPKLRLLVVERMNPALFADFSGLGGTGIQRFEAAPGAAHGTRE